MFPNPRVFLLLVFCISSIHGQIWDLGYRSRSETSRTNLNSFSALENSEVNRWLELQLGTRLSTSLRDLDELEYSVEAIGAPVSYLDLGLRLSQMSQLPQTTSLSHLLFLVTPHLTLFSSWKLYATFGWYKRSVALNKASILPAFFKSSYSEHDFALAAGTEISLSHDWIAKFYVATFEEISVYNLNNPFAHLELGFHLHPMDWLLSAYGRYQVLLGFGRLDALSLGLTLKIGSPSIHE